jgi:cytochrome P450
LGILMGQGLLTSSDQGWLARRRILQTAFHRDSLQTLASTTTAITQQHLQRWLWHAKHQQPLNLSEAILTLVLHASTSFLFNQCFQHPEAVKLINYFYQAQKVVCRGLVLSRWMPSWRVQRFHYARRYIYRVAQNIIAKRQAICQQEWPEDLLSVLLRAHQSDPTVFPSEIVQDEVVTFLATGHETTGNALLWTMCLLQQHPNVLRQLCNETSPVLLKGVIQESLRLYPVIWNFARKFTATENISHSLFPPGAVVMISPYVMQRLPQYWEHPLRFDPLRFVEGDGINNRAYMPFGAGPRTCIASQFSLIQMQIILQTILQTFSVEMLTDMNSIPYDPLIALRPKKNLFCLLKERASP